MFTLFSFFADTASPIVGGLNASGSSFFAPLLHVDFLVTVLIGIAGLIFSIKAFHEARSAKRAALAAGRGVKLQTIVIELTEITQELDGIYQELEYSDARELLTDASRRIRRQLAPIQNDSDVVNVIADLFTMLDNARVGLTQVRPSPASAVITPAPAGSVFNAMDGHFSGISAKLAELTGLLEKRTIEHT